MAWKACNKTELIIEVWEKLDCESVGSAEIEAIEVVIADRYGPEAVRSPMPTARILADEGAHLRHAEIMSLYVERAGRRQINDPFQELFEFVDLRSALSSLERLEKLRTDLVRDHDSHGLRATREAARRCKDQAADKAKAASADAVERRAQLEIVEWLRVWLETPDIFSGWLGLRLRSKDFLEKFGPI